MTRISRKLAAVVGGLLVVVMVPSAAWAPKVFHRTRINGTCTATFQGTAGAGTFGGELQLTHFSASDGALSVVGLLSGSCEKVGDSTQWVAVGPHAVGFDIVSPDVSCAEFKFLISETLTISGTTITLAPVSPTIQADKDTAQRLCGIDRFYDVGRLDQVAHLLNSMV